MAATLTPESDRISPVGKWGPRGATGTSTPDRLDFALLALLRTDPQMTNRAMARRVGVTEQTVAIRIRALIDGHVMRVMAQRDFAAAGYVCLALVEIFVGAGSVDAVAADVARLDEVFSVVVAAGSPEIIANVNGCDADALRAMVARDIARIPGVIGHHLSICSGIRKFASGVGDLQRPLQGPGPLKRQDDLDERLIEMLVEDARISKREVARRVGISEAGVRLRLKRLVDSGIIRIGLVCEPDQIGFEDSAYIFLEGEAEALELAVEELADLDEISFASVMVGHRDAMLLGVARDRWKLPELCNERLRRVPGLGSIVYRSPLRVIKHRFDFTCLGYAR